MIGNIDLNADMGEGFGPWTMGDDMALLDVISSANIACGMHAGDWDVMTATMKRANKKGVGIGAHPGYPDLQGFGRRRISMPIPSLQALVQYQLGAAQAVAKAQGATVRHLKLHGAMANFVAEHLEIARACFEAALAVDPELIIMAQAGTAQQQAVRALGCRAAHEIFADRAYTDNGTLVDRREEGAVIHDPDAIAARVIEMIKAEAIITRSGKHIPTPIDTICLHGDTPDAVRSALRLRAALVDQEFTIAPFEGRKG